MPKRRSKTIPKDEGYVFPTEGSKIDSEELEGAFSGKDIAFDAHDITSKILDFGKVLTGVDLYPYQMEAAYAIIYSVITFSGDVKTMLFSRQSGKSETIAFVIDTLCVLLPALAQIIPDLEQFKNGFRVGLFAPQSDQVTTTYSRSMTRLNSANAEMVLSDPDINVELTSSVRLELTNGSYLAGQVASKQSKIESKTYDLVIVEEAQDVDDLIVSKSIEPMVSACVCAGTMVWNSKGELVPIEKLRKSDGIIGYNGKGFSKETISYFQEPIDKECYRITTHTGRTLECSYDHPILFRERKGGMYGRKMYFKETQDLQVGNQIAILEELPLFGTKTMWEPRLVGWLIGDGSYGIDKTPRLSCCDKEIYSYVKGRFDYVHDVPPRLTSDNRLYQELRIKGITKELREIGIYGQTCEEKRLPKDFHSYDMWSMSEVLGGFFDTDGHVTSDGKRRGSICLSSCVWELLDEVRLALQKFGIHCTIVRKHPGKGMLGHKDYYVLTVSDKRSVENFYKYISFKVSYKQKRLTELVGLCSTHRCKIPSETKGLRFERVVSIEYIGVKPVYNLTADVTHTYVANGIVTHNTGGSIVKVGTTGMFKNHFWYEIQHNRNVDRKIKDIRIRNHFEYDYKRIIKDRRAQYEIDHKRFHLNYEADVMRKKARWGEDSQSFKLAYALIWDLETGMLITDKDFINICNKKLGLQEPRINDYIVAGLDIGKSPAETVLTIGRVIPDEEEFGKPYKQILAWVALGGLDYEAQHHVIMDCIVDFNIQTLYADYTGVGKAVVDRLMYACGEYVNVVPYTFTAQSKSDMWFNFTTEISTRHLIVPANKKVRATPEFMKFEEQMKNCQKYFNGPYMVCEKSEGYFDDFVDSCLSKDTEVLTIEGFKGIDELTKEDLVASVNPDDYSMTYMKPLRKIVKPYKGDMIHFNGEHFEQLISPHHRVLYERKTSSSGKSYFHKTTEFAEKVINRGLNSRFPVSVSVKNEDYPISDAEIKLIGWFITEAWIGRYKKYPNYYRYSIGQSMKVYPKKCKELAGIFKELSLEPYVCDKKNGVRFWQFHKKDNDYFDTLLDRGCHSMPSYWRNFSLRQMQILFKALMDGDGHWNSMTYTTQNKELAYEFSELCHLIGKACYVKEDSATVYKGEVHLFYRCYVAEGGYKRVRGFDLVPYDDRIWCVTVPTGYIVIRYNGKISVTGNCALMCLAANEDQQAEEEMEVMDNPLYGGITDTIRAMRRNSY